MAYEAEILPPAPMGERRERWLAQRRFLITGTDVSAILGCHPQRSPIEVWRDKRGESPITPTDENRLNAGRHFEPAVLAMYTEQTGVALDRADSYTVIPVPDFPLLGATLDARWASGDRRPVDAKTTGLFAHREAWGEPGTDQFPTHYRLQLAVQMMATDTPAADLAVCTGSFALAVYTLYRRAEDDAFIKEQVGEWWERHIVQGHEPRPDASDAYKRHLAQRFARHSDIVKQSDAFIEGWAARLANANSVLAQAEAEKALAENAIKAAMGEAQAIAGICSWRNNKDSIVTDWKAANAELAALVDSERAREIIAAHTTTKPGARVFRFTPKGLLTDGTK